MAQRREPGHGSTGRVTQFVFECRFVRCAYAIHVLGRVIGVISIAAAVVVGFVIPHAARMTWLSPLGPMKFSYAYPIKKKEGDEIQRFQFQLGTTF
jgi:hypothetical protein